MSVLDSIPDKHQGATRDALQRLDRPYTLGTDGDGATHHHSPYDARVVVVAENGCIERAQDLSGRSLSSWIAYVDDKRGWADLQYRATYGQILSEALDA